MPIILIFRDAGLQPMQLEIPSASIAQNEFAYGFELVIQCRPIGAIPVNFLTSLKSQMPPELGHDGIDRAPCDYNPPH